MILSDVESDDLFNLLCGAEIARGCYRTVFACPLDAKWVVKRDTGENFSNVVEWDVWNGLEGSSLRDWLAPCHWLSARGLWLIQSRTEPIPRKLLPKRIPAIFADHKLDNWGMLNGRVVCHDYGNHRIYNLVRKSGARLAPAKWR